jgi:hypothetical protein
MPTPVPPADFLVLFNPTKATIKNICKALPNTIIFSYFTNPPDDIKNMEKMNKLPINAAQPFYLGNINKDGWHEIICHYLKDLFMDFCSPCEPLRPASEFFNNELISPLPKSP